MKSFVQVHWKTLASVTAEVFEDTEVFAVTLVVVLAVIFWVELVVALLDEEVLTEAFVVTLVETTVTFWFTMV